MWIYEEGNKPKEVRLLKRDEPFVEQVVPKGADEETRNRIANENAQGRADAEKAAKKKKVRNILIAIGLGICTGGIGYAIYASKHRDGSDSYALEGNDQGYLNDHGQYDLPTETVSTVEETSD